MNDFALTYQGADLVWLIVYQGISFPALIYASGKFARWTTSQLDAWIRRK